MCRNIRTLFNFEPPATEDEVHDAALQFVRKISGFTKPSQANAAAFERAVEAVASATRELLESLVTSAPPKDREVEAAKARPNRPWLVGGLSSALGCSYEGRIPVDDVRRCAADKIATVAYIEVLTGLVNQKTFPKFIEQMVQGSPRVIAGVAWALSSSRAYPATMLLEALGTEGIAKSALLDVITAHRARLSTPAMRRMTCRLDKQAKSSRLSCTSRAASLT